MRDRIIHPKRTNLPDFRNIERGKVALKAMIEQIEMLDAKKPAPVSFRPTPLVDKVLADIDKTPK